MTFPTYPSTAFVDGNPVTGKLAHGVLNTWRRWQTFAIDIARGGVYVPSTVISIGGSGITLTGSTQRLGLSSRRVTRMQAMAGNNFGAANRWSVDTTTSTASWQNTGPGDKLWLDLDNLPDGGELDEVTLRYEGAAGHASDPPDLDPGFPRVEVWRIDEDGTQTSLSFAVDLLAREDRTAYEAPHDVSVTGVGETIDLTQYRYAVEVTEEDGTDYLAGAWVHSVRAECIVNEYPEW